MSEFKPNMGHTEVLGTHAAPDPPPAVPIGDAVHALGKVWHLGTLTQKVKAQFEQWVRANAKVAWQEVGELEEQNELRSAYIADFAAGKYNWEGGRYIRAALNDAPGQRQLFFLLLRVNHPTITEAQAKAVLMDNPTGAAMAIRWALGNSVAPASTGANGTTTEPTLDG